MNIGFWWMKAGGVDHSVYDSYDLFTRFKYPGFQYGIALAKTAGKTMMRLANADVLPIDFNSFYKTVNDYVIEVKTLLDNKELKQNRKIK